MRRNSLRDKIFEYACAKRVSYVLTTKNHANFLAKALLEYKGLVKSSDELIVIDGASSDATREVISRYKDLVDVYVSEPDKNSAEALNKGILLAKGKYIKPMQDDDVIYPKAMEKAIQVMEKHPEVDLLICGGTKQRGSSASVFYVPEGANYGKNVDDVIKYGACGVGHIMRRRALAVTGLFPTDDAADFTFSVQCIAMGLGVKFCRINLFHHPTYDHSLMIAKEREYRRSYDMAILKYFSKKNYIQYKFLKTWMQWRIQAEKLFKEFLLGKAIFSPAKTSDTKINRRKSVEMRCSSSDLNYLASSKNYKWDGGFS